MASVESVQSQRECLTAAELRSAIDELRPVDLARLSKKAGALAPGTGMEPGDLLQEAVRRSLEGNGGRSCPRDVHPVTFLGNAMRSIASHARDEWAREVPIGTVQGEADPILDARDPRPSPEDAVIGRHDHAAMIARILAMFEDDPHARAIVAGDMDGASADQIRDAVSMSGKEYAAARKRVRRALLRTFPKGPVDE